MSKSNIMVVEDSGIVLLDIQKNLKALGYTVVATASSKEEAIRKADETRPDLVLMDIRLGEEMGGIEAADHIREHFNIPIVFLTGYADEDTFQRAKITDPFGYILKPFDPKGLRTTIEIALHNHELKSKLHESEERYRTLIETMNDGVGQVDAEGKVIFANDTLFQMLGLTSEELIGRDHDSLFLEEHQGAQRKEFEDRKEGIANSFEAALTRKDGTTIPVILSDSPVFDQSGEFAGSIGVFTDISDRKRSELALKASEEKYRKLFSDMSAGCALHEIIYDENGKAVDYLTLEVNAAYERILGVKGEDVVGSKASEALPEKELEQWLGIFGPVAQLGELTNYEMFSPLNNKYFEGSAYSPEPGKFAVTFLDVTDRKRAEEEVKSSKEALEEAERQVHMGHYEIDAVTSKATWSEEIFKIFGIDPKDGEPTTETYDKLLHIDDRKKVNDLFAESIQKGVPFDLVYRIIRSDGELRFVHSSARTIKDENGNAKMFGTLQDITQLKQVEFALQESEERYRTLFENSPIAIWEEDFSDVEKYFNALKEKGVTDFRDYFEKNPDEVSRLTERVEITNVNETSVSFFGASSKDDFPEKLSHYSTQDVLEVFREEFIVLAEGQTKFNSEIVVQDLSGRKRTFFLDLAVAPAYERKLDRVLVSFIDITERKQAEDIMLARYRLVRKSLTEALPELLQATLDEAELLTDSNIGFFHFVDADQINLSLQAWSTNTLQNMCNSDGEGLHYPIDEAGVWVDCVRERRPVIHNEYELLEHRKGFPEGHAEVKRELVVPVLRGEKIVAIIGVGNKEVEYTRKDVEVVSLLADLAWDIVERKQTEAALHESEALYHDLVETAQDLIWQCDEEGRYVYLNPAWEDVFGYELEEMLGKPFTRFQSSEHIERDRAVYANILEGKAVKNFETVHIGKDGRLIYLVFNAKAVYDAQGNAIGARGTAYDITDRKQAEDALKKNEYLLQESQKIAHQGHYMLDISSGRWESSERLNELFGIDWGYKSDVDGWLNIVHPDDRAEMTTYFAEEVIKKHQNFDREYRIVRVSDGETLWVHGLGRLEFDKSGNPIRMLGNIQDITERKQADLALRESADRYRAVVESQTEFIVRWKPDGTRTFVNEAYLRYYDLTMDEALSSGFMPLIAEEDQSAVEAKISRLISGETRSETEVHRVIKPDGSIGWQEWTDHALYDEQGNIFEFQSVGRDITERMQAEETLRQKTSELESLFSISSHLRSAQSAEEMLPVVLAEMRRVLRSDANAVILLDADREYFTYALSDGSLADNNGMKFEVEESISGWILHTRQPYTTEDFSSDPKKTNMIQGDENLGPAILAPVISESEFLGVLVCAREKQTNNQSYTPSEVQLLSAIGEMVGNAFRRATLYDQAMTRLRHVQTLHSIDMAISANLDLTVILDVLLTQGTSQMEVDAACILLLNPHTHMLEFAAGSGFRGKEIKSARLRLGEGLPGQAAMDRKVLHIPVLADAEDLIRTHLLEEGFVSYQAAPLIVKGQLQGVLETYKRKQVIFTEEQTGFLETLATQAAIAIDNSQLFSDLQRSNFELEMAYDATIEGWSRALELRDQETEGHTLRVTDMTVRLAQAMGVRSGELVHVRRGALLHDIGKMGVPDRILLKPGELDADEWEVMKQHTVYAFEMLWPIEFLRSSIDIPHCHHERWDGTGYPRQLKGEQIPLSARVFAIADVWDALTSDRPYRKAWTEDKALEYINANVGKHFDPRVVEQFLKFLEGNGNNRF